VGLKTGEAINSLKFETIAFLDKENVEKLKNKIAS
jgi:hypothetical protein